MSSVRLSFLLAAAVLPLPLYVQCARAHSPNQADQAIPRAVQRPAGAEFYVAPNGTPGGDGSMQNPWDMVTALGQPAAIRPGSTIWIRGGTYGDGKTTFYSRLVGTRLGPIVVRAYPGERAIINGTLQVGCCDQDPHPDQGAYVWFWGLEFASSITDRTGQPSGPPAYGSSTIQNAVDCWAPGARFINNIVHDTRQGIGIWKESRDSTVYGNLIYFNGFQASDRGHGHGIYVQNNDGVKTLADNIIFDQFGVGIHAYGTEQAFVRNIVEEGNIVFNSGSISAGAQDDDNILFASGSGLDNIVVQNNYTYHGPSGNMGYSRVGWQFDNENKTATVRNNYFIGGDLGVMINRWDMVTFNGNTVYSKAGLVAMVDSLPAQNPKAYAWNNNTYYGSGKFNCASQETTWQGWTTMTALDTGSKFSSGRPTGVWSFVRPNRYEQGRANIVIYNWDMNPSVPVDVSSVLRAGTAYEIRDAQNFFGPAVVSGTYDGKPISIPMTGLKKAVPNGNVPTAPVHTAPEFGALILLPLAGSAAQ